MAQYGRFRCSSGRYATRVSVVPFAIRRMASRIDSGQQSTKHRSLTGGRITAFSPPRSRLPQACNCRGFRGNELWPTDAVTVASSTSRVAGGGDQCCPIKQSLEVCKFCVIRFLGYFKGAHDLKWVRRFWCIGDALWTIGVLPSHGGDEALGVSESGSEARRGQRSAWLQRLGSFLRHGVCAADVPGEFTRY